MTNSSDYFTMFIVDSPFGKALTEAKARIQLEASTVAKADYDLDKVRANFGVINTY